MRIGAMVVLTGTHQEDDVSRCRSLITVTALIVSAQLLWPGHSSGRPIEKERFHREFSLVHQNFCGVEGLTVSDIGTSDGLFLLNSRGREQLPYGIEHFTETTVVTNLANDRFVTFKSVVMVKDLKIVDNHDGTFTVTVFGTGPAVVLDEDGKALGRDPGQTRARLLIDNGGTPSNPFDDEFIEFLGIIKESTGRTDDLCAAMVAGIS